jgi:hypothetical protein
MTPPPDPRSTRSLDGAWQFVTDPEGNGRERGLRDPDAAWPGGAETVTVPHAWQEADEHRDYTGTAWYRRTVEYDGAGERTFLRFGAVDYEATVYVDGREVGTNRGGYLPFEVEVTDHLSAGENFVAVEVTDPADLAEIPHGKQGAPWYTRVSGIWGSVTLESRPATYVGDVRATPDLEEDTVTVEVTVDRPAGEDGEPATDDPGDRPAGGGTADEPDTPEAVAAEVTVEREGRAVVAGTCSVGDGSGTCTLSVPDADYWTPDDPALYDLRVDLRADGTVLDSHADYFGMRSVGTDDERLYLNGDPLYVRGALDQAYYPGTLYRPFDVDDLGAGTGDPGDEYATLFEYEIATAKELGFNLLRKHIKPAHPDFVEAADRLGILVWQEPANPTIYTDRSKREVREQLRGLIDRDYNSPSVVVWSLYNEEWGIGLDQADYSDHDGRLWNDPEKQAYLTELYHEAREWDPTRLVCDNSGWAHVATDLNDYHEYYVSPDRHGAWEDGLAHLLENPGENYAVENTPAGEAPILVSEFGTWGFPDLPALREHYGGDPHWFSHDFLDGLKRPEGVDRRFASTDLPDVFGDYDALADAWGTRESVSLRGVIEEMRTRDELAGYVLTEFSDIEWEFNGVLDYLRERKSFADEFARVNADLLVSVDPASHVVAPGGEVTVDAHVVNDTGDPLDGELRWDGPGTAGAESVSVDGFGTTTVEPVATVAPAADADTVPAEVSVTFDADGREVAGTELVFVVADEPAGDRPVYVDGAETDDLAGALGERHPVVGSLADADVAVVTGVTDAVSEFVEEGGRAVLVPGGDGRMADTAAFEFRELPAGESWNLVASLCYQDSDLFDGLTTDARVGWAFEDLFAYDLVADPGPEDDLHAGSVEGWVADWASPLVVRERGDGSLCACTFRVTDAYGEHPTATALLDRLVRTL